MSNCIKCGRDTRFRSEATGQTMFQRARPGQCDICSKDAMEKLREQRVRDDPQ